MQNDKGAVQMEQITIRMPKEHILKIEEIARKMGLKKSDITRMAIKNYINGHEDTPRNSVFAKARHLIGVAESGVPDLGQNHRKYLIDRITKSGASE